VSIYPIPGRCGACHRPCEQYPSGRYRHLNGHGCGGVGAFPLGIPSPPKVFVPDGEPLPEPPLRGGWVVNFDGDDGLPTSMGWHSPRHIAEMWAAWREHVNADRAVTR
jgi:hypothetical protein